MAVAVATFLIALALIASERLHRTKVALLGAAIVVLFVPGFSQNNPATVSHPSSAASSWIRVDRYRSISVRYASVA